MNVSTASEWIIRCGMQLYRQSWDVGPLDTDRAWLKTAGPLYDGKRGFCRDRWQFWKSRFSKLKGEVGEVAKMVEQALDAMEKAEKVMKKRDLDLDTGETARLFKSPRT